MENAVTREGSSARARTATLVAVGPPARVAEAVEVLDAADQAGSLRRVLISTAAEGDRMDLLREVAGIENVRPEYLNNAIAALRLSSLPTVVWWRGGPPERLEGVASLADRVLLDAEDALPLWRRAPALFEHTAITDLRWARLTRWRTVMAVLFDLPQVRDAADAFTRLSLTGSDRAGCLLFGGWLDAALGWQGRVVQELHESSAGPLSIVDLRGPSVELHLERLPNGVCVATEARVDGRILASRVASLGDQGLPALLAEELRIRSRDLAFEAALARIGPVDGGHLTHGS